ncbi:ergosterol biosynthesis ERG4/ERG24 family-domain-containing protein [Ochromonadaceae sp. CCMP2298]|nr:ergosterol biosynthesis ERG4/ERG24 family-domain-containing protein [Ochromonadaceae sp. CCMP2298]
MEFGGPWGALGVILGLPVVIYGLFFLCSQHRCLHTHHLLSSLHLLPNPSQSFDWDLTTIPTALFSYEGSLMYLGWFLLCVLLERILPGEVVQGAILPAHPLPLTQSAGPTPAGAHRQDRLQYVMSGHLQFWLSVLLMGHAMPKRTGTEISGLSTGSTSLGSLWASVGLSGAEAAHFRGFFPLSLELIYDHYVPLISIAVLFTTLFSIYLYVSSFFLDGHGAPKLLARGGNTGNCVYDFFIGRELNPRWGSLDLKQFCELRPGLIGWVVINMGMAAKQLTKTGSLSMSMVLVNLLQGFYVWDALYCEKAILTTMDITTDGFGFMLCFGDLAWVPFIYSLQARYLVDYDPGLSVGALSGVVAVQLLGYYIFRSANSQKDAFRRDPEGESVRHLTFLQTARGTRLLTSGWWGSARKINYTGDWLITFSWCLLCGGGSPIPYFQAVYFLVLLVHRAIRDDKMCEEKYGADWAEYKRLVPYWFVPGVI